MNKYFLIFRLALLLSPCLSFAQSNFRSATIVKMNGDTTSGFIKYEGWTHSPSEIQFKKNVADTQIETLNPSGLKSFSVNGIENYVGYIGTVSVNKIEGDGLAYVRDSTVKPVSVFLRVVTNGTKVVLLAHRDEIKTAYFIMEKNGKPQELKFYRYYNDNDRMVSSAPFRAVLIGLLEKYRGVDERWFREVGTAAYNLSTLQAFVKVINNDQVMNSNTTGHRFFIGAAAAYHNITMLGPETFNFQPTSNTVPVVSLGYDFYNNRFVQRTILRVEASVTKVSPHINGNQSFFSYNTLIISFKPQLLYSFVTDKKVKPFLGIGVGINIPASSANGVTATESGVILTNAYFVQTKGSTYKSLQAGETAKNPYGALNVFITPEIKAGLAFNKKFEMIASGTLISTSLTPNFKNKIHTYSIGFNYYLSDEK